jgi:multimeric flavodoxin WrbA
MMIIVESSPRRTGNGSYLAERLEQKYPDNIHIRLREMNFKGCLSCGLCRKNDSFCVQKDELTSVYPQLAEADHIVLISPNYMGFLNGEAKAFLDRFYCMRDADKRSRFKEGATFIFLFTQEAHNRDKGSLAVDWMKRFAEKYSMKYFGMTIPGCERDSMDGVKLKEQDVMMNLSFLIKA